MIWFEVKIFTAEIINQIGLESRKDCEMILFTGRPVDWLGRVLPEAKFEEKNAPRFFNLFYLSDWYRDVCKNGDWGLVEWVGNQLTGWGGSSQKQNLKKKMHLVIWYFLIWTTDTEISVKKTVFGDQLNGLGTSWLGGEGPPRSQIWK